MTKNTVSAHLSLNIQYFREENILVGFFGIENKPLIIHRQVTANTLEECQDYIVDLTRQLIGDYDFSNAEKELSNLVIIDKIKNQKPKLNRKRKQKKGKGLLN